MAAQRISEITFHKCLACGAELFRSGPSPLGGRMLVKGSPKMRMQDGVRYMECPHCQAKNAFDVIDRPPGQGVELRRMSHLLA